MPSILCAIVYPSGRSVSLYLAQIIFVFEKCPIGKLFVGVLSVWSVHGLLARSVRGRTKKGCRNLGLSLLFLGIIL